MNLCWQSHEDENTPQACAEEDGVQQNKVVVVCTDLCKVGKVKRKE